MTPPHFQLDDEVEVIGTETRFKISQIQKNPNGEIVYSAVGEPYYPASSLRLVEELHVGDWVEVVKDTFSCTENDIGKIMRVCSEPNPTDGGIELDSGMWHHPEGLRKLAPDEIAKHLAPTKDELDQIESQFKLDRRLSDIEKQLVLFSKNVNSRLDALEGERPEICDCKPAIEPISIAITGNWHYTNVFKCYEDALAWCKVVLDSMKEA